MKLQNIIQKFVGQDKQSTAGAQIERKTINYNDARSVGVLFSSSNEDNHKAITYFVKLLQKDNKKVNVLAYFDEKHTNPYDFRFDFFTKKDVDYLGRINCLQVNEFMEKKFDYLYCINPQPFPLFDYILQRSQAHCRVGKYHSETTDCFELMVDTRESNDTVDLILQMLHYTKSLLVHNEMLVESPQSKNKEVQHLHPKHQKKKKRF